jgi:hypothetical protein
MEIAGASFSSFCPAPSSAAAARVPVAAATWGYEAGRRTLLFHSQATTNANGDYALPAIVRGEYFILADDRRSTFSFATPEKLRAEAVTVAAGETRHVDLIVNEDASAAQGPRFTVSGRVEFPPARPEARGFAGIQEATLLLADRNDPRDPAQAGWDAKINRFEFRDVAPGSYDLFATGFLDEHFGPPVTDRKTIEVSNANVEGIGMSVRRGPDMRSRWLVDGKPSGKDGNPLHCLWFRVNDATRFSFDVTPDRQGRIHPNDLESRWDQGKGEFVTEGVPPGIYSVDLSPCSPYYLADVRQGGKSVIDEGFLVGRDNAQPIELLIRTDGGSIQGIVQDAGGKPVPGAVVALVPPLSRRSNWNLYAHTVSNEEDGSFTFGYGFNPVVAPGEYKLFAWKKVPEGAWTNAEFLARYERYGQTITVIPGASASARVQLAPDPR